jgi:hypothetical protein
LTPTSTDSATAYSIPPIIVTQTISSSATTQTTDTGIPSALPKVITPDGGVPEAPSNSTLIQIGFQYPLNYPFVVSNQVSVAQIFSYLPVGLSYGLGGGAGSTIKVTMHTLQPYDTTRQLGYVTTIALAYIPSDLVSALALALHTPPSGIYNNPDTSVHTLMSMINPTFPITAGSTLGSSSDTGSDSSSSSSSSSSDGGALGGDDATSKVSGTTIGIGVGVAAGAAVYGAAMFMVARRYKNRRQRHQRQSSLSGNGPQMGQASSGAMGGAIMSGGRQTPYTDGRESRGSRGSGNTNQASIRTQQISGPMMAENSLGWT